MPYISIVDLNGKEIRYWIAKKLGTAELKAIECFNAEQKRAIERQRKADSRHKDDRSLDVFDSQVHMFKRYKETGKRYDCKCYLNDFSENSDLWIVVREVLSSCTQMQAERFLLFLHGYSNSEIARIQRCTNKAVEHSILDIFDKIKKNLI